LLKLCGCCKEGVGAEQWEQTFEANTTSMAEDGIESSKLCHDIVGKIIIVQVRQGTRAVLLIDLHYYLKQHMSNSVISLFHFFVSWIFYFIMVINIGDAFTVPITELTDV
jgi:hypothetical protein